MGKPIVLRPFVLIRFAVIFLSMAGFFAGSAKK